MEKPQSVVYLHDGQTRVTLIGQWFHMAKNEIEEEYERRLKAGDPWAIRINSVLCDVIARLVRNSGE